MNGDRIAHTMFMFWSIREIYVNFLVTRLEGVWKAADGGYILPTTSNYEMAK